MLSNTKKAISKIGIWNKGERVKWIDADGNSEVSGVSLESEQTFGL